MERALEARPILIEAGYSRAVLAGGWKLILKLPAAATTPGAATGCTNPHGDPMAGYLRELARVTAAAPPRLSASREARRRRVAASASADAAVPRKAPSSRCSAVPKRWRSARPGDRIALTTMPASRPTLGVSSWPDFDYDASGATTLGVVEPPDEKHPDALRLRFDVRTFEGPPVCGRTTRVFGVPLPPGVRIDIVPLSLHGWLDPDTGACALDFDAEFRGSVFGEGFIKLPAMTVRSPLTTGAARGQRRARFSTNRRVSRRTVFRRRRVSGRAGALRAPVQTELAALEPPAPPADSLPAAPESQDS